MKASFAFGSLFLIWLLSATPAHADSVTINYDFRGGSSLVVPTIHTSLTFSATSVTPPSLTPGQVPQITATGQAFSESPFTVANSFVGQTTAGLGVYWTGTVSTPFGNFPATDIDGNEVDGLGPDEALHLTFTNFGLVDGVELNMAGFTLTNEPLSGGNEQARLFKNNVLIGTITMPNTITVPVFVDLSSFGITLDENDVFSIRVAGGSSDFAVMGVQLTANTVPEPGLSALLVAGLVGVGIRRARRRRAA
jgi:hypothetical protein